MNATDIDGQQVGVGDKVVEASGLMKSPLSGPVVHIFEDDEGKVILCVRVTYLGATGETTWEANRTRRL